MKRLLAYNKRILKGLHDEFMIDFEKDVIIKAVQLPKTINAIIKENKQFITKDTVNLLLIQDKWLDRTNFRVVKFNHLGTININNNCSYSDGLDNYYTKKDFEESRKNADLKAFVIIGNQKGKKYCQLRNDIRVQYYDNYNIRANNKKAKIIYGNYSIANTVNGFFDVAINNIKFNYRLNEIGYCPSKTYKENDLIDKSGYNIYKKRQDLKAQADSLRLNRNVAKLEKYDFAKENTELKNKIETLYREILQSLEGVDILDYKRIGDIANLLNWQWTNVAYSFKEHIKQLDNIHTKADDNYYHNYHSVSEVQENIQSMNKDIESIRQKLKKILL